MPVTVGGSGDTSGLTAKPGVASDVSATAGVAIVVVRANAIAPKTSARLLP